MFLNRGQLFKPFRYQPLNEVNNIAKDPLVTLTSLLINYAERESVMSYQHQIDILSANVLRLLEQDSTQKNELYFQQSMLGIYFRDFISNVNTIHIIEEAEYHLEILIKEISAIPDNISLKIKGNKNSFLKNEWNQKKKYIDLIINQFMQENQAPIFQLINKPLKIEENHSLIDFYYTISIIIILLGILLLLLAVFKDNT